jgi:hypothetical protein
MSRKACLNYYGAMVSHLYRFRSTKQLLDGFNELEAQQIYFAPPEDLNDQVETFKDIVWTGDEIVWRNLLRHYILIFIEATSRVFSGVDCDRNQVRSFVSMVPDNLPPAPVRAIYDRSSDAFLNETAVRRLVELMAGRTSPIRRYELTNYLRSLHPFAMDAVFKEYAAHGIMAPPSFLIGENLEPMRANAIKMMESAALLPGIENASETAAEAFFRGK